MFSERLKNLRKQAGYSRANLATKLGLSISSISNYENNIRKPDSDEMWRKIASVFDVSVDYLMGEEISKLSSNEIEKLSKKGLILKDASQPQNLAADKGSIDNNPVIINGENRKDSDIFYDNNTKTENSVSDDTNQDTVEIPILGDVAAGMGCFADNSIIGYETLPQTWINPHHEYILLRVKGDSMFPKFEENDLLLIKAQNSVDSGDYAVALIEDEVGVVKRIFYDRDWIELISANPSYPARRFEGADVQKIRIVGVVEKCIRNVK